MLIIFDLDDTLIETSKYVTPRRLKMALEEMILAGFSVSSFEKMLQELLAIDQKSFSSKQALIAFSSLYPESEKFFPVAMEALYSPLRDEEIVPAAEGAIEILNELKKDHQLALVTMGNEPLQLQKMKKAGIEPQIFSKLIVGSGSTKKPYYETLLSELGTDNGIVCGDRIPLDLSPAKQLGLTTVHMRAGRGLHIPGPSEDVDYAIAKLEELTKIIHYDCKKPD